MIAFLLLVVTLASLALAAFCAGCETGFLSVRRGRIIHMAREGGQRAKIVYEAISHMGRTTTALLVGNNLASVLFSSASAALSVALFPDSTVAQTVWGCVAAVVILYFGEFAPKLICSARPIRRMLALAPYWERFAKVFVPVGSVVHAVICRFVRKRESGIRVTPDTVQRILRDRKDGVKLSNFESALIGRILELRSNGEFITSDSLLTALDNTVV